jgi:hypothetical protein
MFSTTVVPTSMLPAKKVYPPKNKTLIKILNKLLQINQMEAAKSILKKKKYADLPADECERLNLMFRFVECNNGCFYYFNLSDDKIAKKFLKVFNIKSEGIQDRVVYCATTKRFYQIPTGIKIVSIGKKELPRMKSEHFSIWMINSIRGLYFPELIEAIKKMTVIPENISKILKKIDDVTEKDDDSEEETTSSDSDSE